MRRLAVLLSAAFALGACRSARPTNALMTELTIQNVDRLLVADALTRAMLNRGYKVRTLDDRRAVFARPADPMPGAMLLGSGRDNTPENRVLFAFTDEGSAVRIVARVETVTNSGTKMEHASQPNGGDDTELVQQALMSVRDRLTKKAPVVAAPAEPQPAAAPKPAATKSRTAPRPAEPAPAAEPAPKARREPAAKKPDWDKNEDAMAEDLRKRMLGN